MDTTNIYVLKLEDNCYYVGKSDNLETRIQDHFNGNGSAWTKKHRPIEVVEIRPNVSTFEEDKATKEYMAKYGLDNVRGGSYVTVNLDAAKRKFLMEELRMTQDCCTRCGRNNHFVAKCYAKTDVNGNSLEPLNPEEKFCHRCGRNTHDTAVCHNKTHINGYRLDSVPVYPSQSAHEHVNPLIQPINPVVQLSPEPVELPQYPLESVSIELSPEFVTVELPQYPLESVSIELSPEFVTVELPPYPIENNSVDDNTWAGYNQRGDRYIMRSDCCCIL